MNILIQNGRVIDPASGFDHIADVAVADGHIVAIVKTDAKSSEKLPANFQAEHTIDAKGCIVAPGLVDLQVRLREPGYEHEGMLDSELTAAVAGGVTSLVCPPDTDPVLDEPGLIEMLKFRAEKLHRARVFPLGALTRGLKGEVLTEMSDLTDAGCVGFSQAEVPLENTQVLQRALQYAATFGYRIKLLGIATVEGGKLLQRVHPCLVPIASPLGGVDGPFNAVQVEGDGVGRVLLLEVGEDADVVGADLSAVAQQRAGLGGQQVERRDVHLGREHTERDRNGGAAQELVEHRVVGDVDPVDVDGDVRGPVEALEWGLGGGRVGGPGPSRWPRRRHRQQHYHHQQ